MLFLSLQRANTGLASAQAARLPSSSIHWMAKHILKACRETWHSCGTVAQGLDGDEVQLRVCLGLEVHNKAIAFSPAL